MTPAARTRLLVAAVVLSLVPVLALPLVGPDGDPLRAVAGTAGLAGAVLIWWQFLLGIRHVSARVTPDRGAVVTLHAWLGSAGAFLVLVHPLLEMYADRRDLAYLVALDFAFAETGDISLGRLALLGFLAVWLTSTLARSGLPHRVWHGVHHLSYPLAVLVFLHANAIGTYLLSVPWLRAYWYALAACFLAMCAFRLVAPLRAPRYRVIDVRAEPGATRCTLHPVGRALHPGPGQFVGLRTRVLGRAHPFSAVDVTAGGGLVLVVGHVGPFTRRLRGLSVGDAVRLDGPYGSFAADAGDGPAVLIAGGVGVTPFARIAAAHPDAVLFHVSRGEPVLGADLAAACGPRYVPVTRSTRPGPGVRPGRFHVRDIAREIGPDAAAGARYFVCGSPRFVDGVRADLRAEGVPRARVHAESFDA